jgi:hypothetical protein
MFEVFRKEAAAGKSITKYVILSFEYVKLSEVRLKKSSFEESVKLSKKQNLSE